MSRQMYSKRKENSAMTDIDTVLDEVLDAIVAESAYSTEWLRDVFNAEMAKRLKALVEKQNEPGREQPTTDIDKALMWAREIANDAADEACMAVEAESLLVRGEADVQAWVSAFKAELVKSGLAVEEFEVQVDGYVEPDASAKAGLRVGQRVKHLINGRPWIGEIVGVDPEGVSIESGGFVWRYEDLLTKIIERAGERDG